LQYQLLTYQLSGGGGEAVHDSDLVPVAIDIQLYTSLLVKFFNQALEARLRDRGERISSLQYGILRMLQFDILTISEIRRRMGLDPSTLVRAVDALERNGLARRGSDPHDRRRNPIAITDKGMQLVSSIPAITVEDLTFQALQSFGIESATRLRDLLRGLIKEFPEGRMVTDMRSSQMDRP
jgi:DNA-binding MarR family transcriptional regulator